MKKSLLVLTSFLFALSVMGQVTFEKTYNIGISAISGFVASQDDGYLMAMITLRPDDHYLTFVKTDLNGDSLWIKDYYIGHVINETLTGVEDEEGNIYILPNSEVTDVMKFDEDANMIWGKKYTCRKRRLAVKDNILWVTGDQGTGNYLFKIDAGTGDSLWRSELFNEISYYSSSVATSVAVLENNDVIVTASQTNFQGLMLPSSFYRLPADSNEMVQFNLSTNELFVVSDTKALGNEIISVANVSPYPSGQSYSYFLRYTSDGTINNITKENLGYPTILIYKCIITNENQVVESGQIFTGPGTGNVILHCLSMDGDSLWTHLYGNRQTNPWDLILAGDNGFVLTGGMETVYDQYKPYLLKTDMMGLLTGLKKIGDNTDIVVYPNPAVDEVFFLTPGIQKGTITIFDSKGRICTELPIQGEQTSWPCTFFPKGLYLYRIEYGGEISTGKLVVD